MPLQHFGNRHRIRFSAPINPLSPIITLQDCDCCRSRCCHGTVYVTITRTVSRVFTIFLKSSTLDSIGDAIMRKSQAVPNPALPLYSYRVHIQVVRRWTVSWTDLEGNA